MTGRGVKRLGCVAAVLVALAAAAHLWYWYWPRLRPATPHPSGVAGRIPDLPLQAWVPFPHQNLAAIEDRAGDLRRVVLLAAGIDTGRAVLDSGFGPLVAPAARELAVASDGSIDRRDRLWISVDLYPMVAALVRTAGALADNPWLGGGSVILDGRPGMVKWSGTTWTLDRGAGEPGDDGSGAISTAGEAALSAIELQRPRGAVPTGRYTLRRVADGFRLATLDGGEGEARLGPLPDEVAICWAREGGDVAVLLLRSAGGLVELPSAAAFGTRGEVDELLPLGELLSALGRLPGRDLDGGELVATDREALAAAAPFVAGRLRPWLGEVGVDQGFAVRVDPATRWARRAAESVEAVGLLDLHGAERWNRLVAILEALDGTETVEGWVGRDGDASLWLRVSE